MDAPADDSHEQWTLDLLLTNSTSSAPVAAVVPTQPPVSNPTPTAAIVPSRLMAQEVNIGNSVGNHAPDFEFSLADGAQVSSASLSAQSNPAYLYFFAVW